MTHTQATGFFHELKGAPLALLLALCHAHQPLGRNRLGRTTGYAAHTVQQGLLKLEELGFARRFRRVEGWTLTAEARRTVHALFGIPSEPEPAPETETLGDAPEVQSLPPAPSPTALDEVQPPHPASQMAAPEVQTVSLAPGPAAPDNVQTMHRAFPAAVSEMHNLHLGGSSSSSLLDHAHDQTLTTTTTTTRPAPDVQAPHLDPRPVGAPAREIDARAAGTQPAAASCPPHPGDEASSRLPLESEAQVAVAQLRHAGCPNRTAAGKGALDAVEIALARGWSGANILDAVEGWLAYAASPQGRTIAHPGFFTASRLRCLERPPALDVLPSRAAATEAEHDAFDAFGPWKDYVAEHVGIIVQH